MHGWWWHSWSIIYQLLRGSQSFKACLKTSDLTCPVEAKEVLQGMDLFRQLVPQEGDHNTRQTVCRPENSNKFQGEDQPYHAITGVIMASSCLNSNKYIWLQNSYITCMWTLAQSLAERSHDSEVEHLLCLLKTPGSVPGIIPTPRIAATSQWRQGGGKCWFIVTPMEFSREEIFRDGFPLPHNNTDLPWWFPIQKLSKTDCDKIDLAWLIHPCQGNKDNTDLNRLMLSDSVQCRFMCSADSFVLQPNSTHNCSLDNQQI